MLVSLDNVFRRMKAKDYVAKKQQQKCFIHNTLATFFYLAKTAWSKIFHSSSEILLKVLLICTTFFLNLTKLNLKYYYAGF